MNGSLHHDAKLLGGAVSNGQILCPGPRHSPRDRSLSLKPSAASPIGYVLYSFANDDPLECMDYVRAKLGYPPFEPGKGPKPRQEKPNGSKNGEEKFVENEWEYAQHEAEGPQGEVRRVIDKMAPFTTAKLFRDEIPSALHHHRDVFYLWNGRAYDDSKDGEIRAEIYPFLEASFSKNSKGKLSPVKPNSAMVSNVLDGLRAAAHLDGTISPPSWLRGNPFPPSEILGCTNGLLHLPTLQMIPNTPELFTLNALDFAYDKDADTPAQWLEFLEQLWPNDPQSIETLQEIFGYCLTPDTRQQKAFLMVGPKRSGKGTIGRVLGKLIGTENTVAPTLAGLGTNFGIEPLIGKRVAIISDAHLGGRADQHAIAERLLSIISNELPRLADASGALASRLIVLLMTESFYGREDQTLTQRLLGELPGILNWAIEGWWRLEERGHFQQPPSALDAVHQLEDLGSPINAFVREKCEVGAGLDVSTAALFLAWQNWCGSEGRDHPGTKATFGRDLLAACPGLKKGQRGNSRSDDREKVYKGIRLMGETYFHEQGVCP